MLNSVISGTQITARVVVQFHQAFSDPHVGFQIRDRRGEAVFMTHTHGMHQKIGPVQPGEQVEVQYSFDVPLITGDYTFTAGVAQGGLMGGAVADPIARTQDAWAFQVVTNLDDIHALCGVEHEGVEGAILGRSIYEGTLDFAAAQKLADELDAA